MEMPYLSSTWAFEMGRRLSWPHAYLRYPAQVLRNTSSTAFIFAASAAAVAVATRAASGSHVVDNFIALSGTSPKGDGNKDDTRDMEERIRARPTRAALGKAQGLSMKTGIYVQERPGTRVLSRCVLLGHLQARGLHSCL